MKENTAGIEGRFILALVLTGMILIVEIAGGLLTDSLALLSDAAHIFLDMLALGMSYGALRLAARPADERHTYGYHRFQVLAALVNGATLLIVAVGIFREAWLRLREPSPVLAGPMLVVAVIGLFINLAVALILRKHDHDDLNVRSAFLHVLGDTLSSVGVIGAGLIILFTGQILADPIVSVLIGVIILVGSGRVLRESLHILIEGTPEGLSVRKIADAICQAPGVSEVHDLHIWTVSPGFVTLSVHVVLDDPFTSETPRMQQGIRQMLAERFNLHHTTIQVECDNCGQGAQTCANGH